MRKLTLFILSWAVVTMTFLWALIHLYTTGSTKLTVILIPYSALLRSGFTEGPHFDYYASIGGNWADVIGETGHDWSDYSLEAALSHRRYFNMTKTDRGLVLTYNTTIKMCLTLSLWQYVSGRDPRCVVALCYDPTQKVPSVSVLAQEQGGQIFVLSSDNSRNPVDELFHITTGISANNNNWLLLAEQSANSTDSSCVVCLGARPVLKVIPASLPATCLLDVMTHSVPTNTNCSVWDTIYPVTDATTSKPVFSTDIASSNFTCISLIATGPKIGSLDPSSCAENVSVPVGYSPIARADIWWWCGEDKIYDRLPRNVSGHCALISLLLPVNIYPITAKELMQRFNTLLPTNWGGRTRRSANNPWLHADDPTYIDPIGVPRGVPDEYKLADQIAAGFESSICWWCTTNKNVDRINYVHYNVQRLGNQTEEGFRAVHEQLRATSLMTFQNRIAVDMLLAEKGGVCAIFGDQCCTFIPNNTAPEGRLTKAIEGLRTLNKKMKDHSGVDTSMWDRWMDAFGRYKSLVSSLLISVAVFASILTLCGCCCIPCVRSLANRVITTAIEGKAPLHQMMPLIPVTEDTSDVDEDETDHSMFRV
uniref:Uncharacterized protein n=1 Tax=Seriola lalandi dorsalis TaxID=1841481 RepID=A0A3B4YA05_SERLL